MTSTLVLFCLAIVGVSLLGGLLPLATLLSHTRLQVYLSASAGAMLGAVFFHMLPEAVRLGSADTLQWSAAGLLTLFLVERFFSFHHHEAPDDPEAAHPGHHHQHDHGPSRKGNGLQWKAAALGLALHSLAGGVALASAAAAGGGGLGAAAWGVFLATLLHKPADALTVVTLMLRAGASRPFAHLVNLGFSLMIPAGVALFFLGLGRLGQDEANRITAAALAFSAGTFLCIALSDLLPELQFHTHDRVKLSVALVGGLALMALSTFWEGPEGQDAPPASVPAGADHPR